MQIKLLVSAAAIALAGTVGSAFAADTFSTLEGITAEVLTSQEMGVVMGAALQVRIGLAGGAMGPDDQIPVTGPAPAPDGKLAAITNIVVPMGVIPAGGTTTTVFTPEE